MMEDLSLHILDIAENAAGAGATRVLISIDEDERRDRLTFRVTDNGRGMSAEEKTRALDPFFTTGRKRTGLGLPLLAQTAETCGGRLSVRSERGIGTRVSASFPYSHVDRPPLTRMAQTLLTFVFAHREIDVVYRHARNGSIFKVTRRGRAGGAPAPAPADIVRLREKLRAGLASIGTS